MVKDTTVRPKVDTWSSNGPVPLVVECAAIRRFSCVAALDPRQRYLDHHRPCGQPLLSTVMGIETMARAARLVEPAGRIVGIVSLALGPPCVIEDKELSGRIILIEAATEEVGPEQASVACKVTSEEVKGNSDWYFTTRVRFGGPSRASDRILLPRQPSNPVRTRDIYSFFFHGPWFRVIGEAGMVNGEMIARSSLAAPDLFEDGRYEAAPRAIEFGLQTAGLLELAETGRIMIPKAIREIEISHTGDLQPGGGVIAVAKRSSGRDGHESYSKSIDVVIVNVHGRVLIQIKGFETTPLPFSSACVSLDHVKNLLRSSAAE